MAQTAKLAKLEAALAAATAESERYALDSVGGVAARGPSGLPMSSDRAAALSARTQASLAAARKSAAAKDVEALVAAVRASSALTAAAIGRPRADPAAAHAAGDPTSSGSSGSQPQHVKVPSGW